jgi:hypothetical protein
LRVRRKRERRMKGETGGINVRKGRETKPRTETK